MVDFLTLIPLLLNNCKITPIKSCLSFDSELPMSRKLSIEKDLVFSSQESGFFQPFLTLETGFSLKPL